MSAARLREAAALMRSRAKGANSGPWHADEDYGTITASPYTSARQAYDRDYANDVECSWVVPESMDSGVYVGDLRYIAAMHPVVALAVADMLDQEAALHESYDCMFDECAALAVADAFLSTVSEPSS